MGAEAWSSRDAHVAAQRALDEVLTTRQHVRSACNRLVLALVAHENGHAVQVEERIREALALLGEPLDVQGG